MKSPLLREFQPTFWQYCLLQGTKLIVLAMLPSSEYKTDSFGNAAFFWLVLYPEEGSIAKTLVETLLTASILIIFKFLLILLPTVKQTNTTNT